jgi:hypothetical protein
MSLQGDLLEQARHLAKRERRRPKQASLRRAISTAYYYALIHLLVAETTRILMRAARVWEFCWRHCRTTAGSQVDTSYT